MKKYIQMLSFFLVFCISLTTLPVKSLAEQPISKSKEDSTKVTSNKLVGKITKELVDKRERNVKQFLKDDGTYEAVIYPNPVHYLDNGDWKDIDNTLDEVYDTEANGHKVLTTKQNDYKVQIDENANSKKLVSIQKDKYGVEWNIDKANDSNVTINKLDETAVQQDIHNIVSKSLEKIGDNADKENIKSVLKENEQKKTLNKISSEVSFYNIFKDVDLQYIINSDKVKENIILNKLSDNNEFSFNLKVKNLTAKVENDNSIVFYDDKDSKKTVFKMQAPFMEDANKTSSNKIAISLERSSDGYKLTLKPDSEWLNDSSRVFPVTIDPSIRTSLDVNSIHDTFISQNNPDQNNYAAVVLGVGKGSTSGITRSFIKFDLPTLTSGSIITYAQLSLALYTANATTRQINVHKINSNWYSDTLTWNNAPGFDPTVQDYQLVNGSAGSYWYLDATSIVKDWYNTGNNYGLMVKNNDESAGYNEFFSSDCSSTYTIYRPQITLNYINNSGLENYWTYHSQSVGRAGTGYVNDYNGNLVFIHDDLSLNGSRMPININHVYNSNDRSTSFGYGNGWRLNLNQGVIIENIGGTNCYCYVDEDGTKHYFYYDSASSSYKDETGLNITLTVNSDNSYDIKDKGGNQLLFVPGGYLYKIIDTNGNYEMLSYNGVVLTQITDGAGRITKLDSTPEGYLLGITDPAGRRTSFAYNGINLQTITYPDGKQTVYNYDSNNNLTSAINYDGYKVTYSYNSGVAHRVMDVLEGHTDGTLGQDTSIAYGNNITTFTDVKGRKDTYQFNNWGNTVSTQDSQGNANYTQYNEQVNDPNKNKTTLSSKTQKVTVNYLKNHNVETTGYWGQDYWGTLNGSFAFTTETSYNGKQSLKVVKNDNLNRQHYTEALSMQKGKTYTLSAYLKTSGISNSNGKGAAVFVNYQNSAGAWQTVDSKYINGTNDWQRSEVTFTLPSDAASTTVYARAGIIEETGTVYIDCLQLEDGDISNRYNLVENSDFNFDTGVPVFWTANSLCDSNDTQVNIEGRNAFRFNGVATSSKNIYQSIQVSGNTGDVFVLSGWAKGQSVPLSPGRYFALDVGLVDANGNINQWEVLQYNQDCSDWQYAAKKLIAKYPYKSVTIYALYYNNSNTAYFDNIQLYKEEFGQSYTYDSNGNIVSTADLAKQNSSFAYNSSNDLITSTDAKGSQFKYDYDTKHNITKATSAENVVYSFTYDSNGNPLTSKIGDSVTYINSSATYTTSGNYVNSLTDSSGNTVTNSWDENKGLLNNVTDAKGKVTTNTYDPNTDKLLSTSKTADGQQITNSYGYLNDRLNTITHNGFSYNFGYDSLGNNTTVSVGSQNLITNSYEARTGKLLQSTYGNGQQVSSDYDSLDRVTAKKYNGITRYTYEYDASGNVGYHQDLVNGASYRNIYDIADRLVQVKDSIGNVLNYSYDSNNNNSKISDKVNGKNYDTSYGYNKDNKLNSIIFNRGTSSTITQNYDSLGRLSTRSVNAGSVIYNTIYGYLPGANGNTTPEVSSIINNGSETNYNYDASGNIITIKTNKNLLFDNDFPSMGKRDFSGTHPELTDEYVIPNGAPCTIASSATAKHLKRNTTYTLSFDAISWYGVVQPFYVDLFPDTLPEARFTTEANNVKHYVWTFTTPDLPEVENCHVRFFQVDNNAQPISFCKTILVEGDKEANILYQDDFPAYQKQVDFYGTHPEKVDLHIIPNGAPCTIASSATTKHLKRNTTYTLSFDALSWYNIVQTFYVDFFPDTLPEARFTTEANNVKHYVWTFTTPDLPEVENCHIRFFQVDNNAQPISFSDPILVEGNKEGESKFTKYYYNELNELVREDNESLNKSITYSYDKGGNLLSKTEYPYFKGALSNPTVLHSYGYEDSNWKDKLTSYDGKAISYDAIGNPLNYNGWQYSWEEGRQLSSIQGNGYNISYKYNEQGIRTSKTVNESTTKYHLVGDKVTYEDNGVDKIYYTYDNNEHLVSMNLNGVEYYYIRNAQGDIIGLFDATGTQVVSYVYDSWGKLVSIDGTLKDSVGVKNPYRYRGYRYDTETGLYYLHSRYYNPEWGRFINADAIAGSVGELLGHNIFAYCKNNPVNGQDPSGYLAEFNYNRWDDDYVSNSPSLDDTISAVGFIGYTLCAIGEAIYGGNPGPLESELDAAKRMENARRLGQQGEKAANIVKNTKRIESLTKTASYRIPDALNETSLTEIKNVKYQGLTNQIKDFSEWSQQEGLQFVLKTRPNTKISAPLQKYINEGKIVHLFIGD